MVSKNNRLKRFEQSAQRQNHFGIRKLTIGAASVLLGTSLFLGTQTSSVKAADEGSDKGKQETNSNKEVDSTKVQDIDHVEVAKQPETLEVAKPTASENDQKAAKSVDQKAPADKPATDVNKEEKQAQPKKVQKQTLKVANQAANKDAKQPEVDVKSLDAIKTNLETKLKTDASLTDAQVSEIKASLADIESYKEILNANKGNDAEAKKARALLASFAAVQGKKADVEDKSARTVTDWNSLQSALNDSSVKTINLSGDISGGLASLLTLGTLSVSHDVTVNGNNYSINLGSGVINNNYSNLTLKDVTVNGSIMGHGNLNIEGTVNSNVDFLNSHTLTSDQLADQTGAKIRNNGTSVSGVTTDNWKAANIQAAKVNVNQGATLNINRQITGDGITEPNHGIVNVDINAKLNINVKDAKSANRFNEQSSSIDNANTGVRILDNGTFKSGDSAEITINAGHGRAVVINEPFGGTSHVANNTSLGDWENGRTGDHSTEAAKHRNTMTLGDSTKMNITGRGGIVLGYTATFTTGDHSIIHIDNQGNGEGLLLDANGVVVVSPHSQLLMTSNGKNASGYYGGGNYIGMGQDGKFRVEHDATFRYRLINSANNEKRPYADNFNIISQAPNTHPEVYVGPNATFDGQSDYDDYYGEIFAFSLTKGPHTSTVFQIDGAKYVNWEKNSQVLGHNGAGNLFYSMDAGLIDATGQKYFVFKWNNKNLNDNNYTFDDSTTENIVNSINNFKNSSDKYWTDIEHLATKYSKSGNLAEWPGHVVSGNDITSGSGYNPVDKKTGTPIGNYNAGDGDPRHNTGFDPLNSQRLVLVATIIPTQEDKTSQKVVPHNVIVKINNKLKPGEVKVVKEGKDGLIRHTETTYYKLNPSSGEKTIDETKGNNGHSSTTTVLNEAQDEIVEIAPQTATINYVDNQGKAIKDSAGEAIVGKVSAIPVETDEDGNVTFDENGNPTATEVIYDESQDLAKAEEAGKGYTKVPGQDKKADKDTNGINWDYANSKVGKAANDNKYNVSGLTKANIIKATAGLKAGEIGKTLASEGPVFKVVLQPQLAKGQINVKFHDTTDNVDILGYGKKSGEQDEGTSFTYNPNDDIKTLEGMGYVLDGLVPAIPTSITEGTHDFVINMKHGVKPVTPDTPPTDVPKTPDGKQLVDPSKLTKDVNLKVTYVNSDNTVFTGKAPSNATQKITFTGNAYVDRVTGQLANAKQEKGQWIVDKDNTATPQITWTPENGSFDAVTSPSEDGYHVTNVSSHKDGNNVAAINGITKDTKDINITVTYAPNGQEVRDTKDVPASQTTKFVDENGKELAKSVVQNGKFHYSGDTYDKVTGKKISDGSWNEESHKFSSVDAPVIPGYVAETKTAEGLTATVAKPNVTNQVVYHKIGKIIPVDKITNKPIPGADQPQYKNDPTDPTKVISNEPIPKVDNYTPVDPSPITPEDPTKDTEVPYQRAVEGSVTYIDDTTNKTLATDPLKGFAGDRINYTTADKIANYVSKGYELVSNSFKDGNETYAEKGNHFEVHLKHGLTPVTPENPQGVDPKKLTKPVKETVHYQGAGDKTPKDVVQDATWTRNLTKDKVTGELVPNGKYDTEWTPSKENYNEVKTPVVEGFHPDKETVPATKVTQDNIEVTVTYAPNDTEVRNAHDLPASQTTKFVDENGKELAKSVVQNSTFHYSGDTYDKVTGKETAKGSWDVESHKFNSVDAPVIQGYVAEVKTADGLTATVKNPNVVNQVVYHKIGKIIPVDNITKKPIPGAEQPQYKNDQNDPTKVVPNEPIPEVTDYLPVNPGQQVTPKDPTKDTEVPYKQVVHGTIKYIDDTTKGTLKTDKFQGFIGDKIDYATAQIIKGYEDSGYKLVSNNFKDGNETYARTGNDFEVHFVHTYSPITPEHPHGVDPKELTKDVKETIKYVGAGDKTPKDNVQTSQWTRQFTWDNVDKKIVPNGELDKGWSIAPGQKTNYDEVKSPEIAGYHPDKVTVPATKVTQNDIEVTVTYAPNGQEVRDTKDVPATQTTKFVDENGKELAQSVVQHNTFHYSGDTYDKFNNQKIKDGSWNEESHKFNSVDAPVIEGYIAETKTADGLTATVAKPDVENQVVYHKIGKIIPVDPNHKPIPDAPTPEYKNDPKDPTKVIPNEPTPKVPGWTTNIPDVTPNDPTKDTQVVYKQAANGTVKYIDDTAKTTLDSVDLPSGYVGDKINYTTAGKIADYEKQGYKLVSNSFKDGNEVYAKTGNNFEVHFVHNLVPVTPEDPHGVDSTLIQKDVKETVKYVGADDKTPKDVVQTSQWTRTLTMDQVTGQLIPNGKLDTAWAIKPGEKTNYDEVKTPEIEGYHADKTTIPATKVTQQDITVVVTYAPNGQEVRDTKEVPATQTTKFIDDNGKEIADSVVQHSTFHYSGDTYDKVTGKEITKGSWDAESHKFNSVNAPVIEGYVAEAKTAEGLTATVDKPNVTNQIVYHKIGKIIPVDPNHDPIPDAPTPEYKNDPKDPTKVVPNEPVPEVPNYTPVDPTPITPQDPTKNTQVVYKQVVDGTVTYFDDTTGQVLGNVDSIRGYVGDKINYSTEGRIDNYTSKGYKLVSDGFTTSDQIFKKAHNNFEVHFVHSYSPVNPQNPNPKVNKDEYSKDYTLTVHYEGAGNQTPKDNVQTSTWTRTLTIDNVTGNIIPGGQYDTDWAPDKKNYDAVPTPNVPDFEPSETVVPAKPTVQKDITETVIYTPVAKDQKAKVQYIDLDDNNKVIYQSPVLTGKAGDTINYNTATKIAELTNKGYELANDGFPAGAAFDNIDDNEQIFKVTFHHGHQPVTPDKPGKPGEPINPDDPEGPIYPEGSDQVTKSITRTIHYEGAGNNTPSDIKQTVNFTAKGELDKVTGQWTTPLTWSGAQTVEGAKTPVVNGYYVTGVNKDSKDGVNVDSATINHDGSDYTVTVNYAPVGKIIPVDPSGKPIPNVPNPPYENDPSDPTKVIPNEPVPEIPGYTPQTPTVTPNDPGKDTTVVYTPILDQKAVVNYIDADEGNKVIETSGSLTGKAGSVINYSTAATIKQLQDKGYVLVNNGFDPNGTAPSFDNDDNTTQTYQVILKHGTTPVTPDKPGKPGEPINPNDPEGPKFPDGTDKDSLVKTGTQIVHYEGAGNQTPGVNTTTVEFDHSMIVDNVTGKIITDNGWTPSSRTYTTVITPTIKGYTPDKVVVGGDTVNVTDSNINREYTVHYTKDPVAVQGKVTYIDDTTHSTIDVDPLNGNVGEKIDYTTAGKISNFESQGYELVSNNFKDGQEVFAENGNNFEVHLKHGTKEVTPKDPDPEHGYTHDSLIKTGTQTVIYSGAGNSTPKTNTTTIEFDHSLVIDKVTGKIVTDNGWTPASQTYTKVTTPTIEGYTPDKTVVGGETVTVNGDINKTYVVTYTKNPDDIIVNGKQTVHYVDQNGDEIRNSEVTGHVTFTKNGMTGNWDNNSYTYGNISVPVIKGYVATVSSVTGKTVTPNDPNQEVWIHYKKIGNIVPIDPNGNPIPDPTNPNVVIPDKPFINDPNDPTKVIPNEPVPTIPGWIPSTPTVTPEDPSTNIPVIYHKDTKQNAQVQYIDQDNNNSVIAQSNILTGKAGDKIDYSTAETIKSLENKGYVLVADNFKNAIFDNIDGNTQVFQVILKHGTTPVTPDKPGKPGEPINPNDPQGPKFPDGTDKQSLIKTGTQTVHYVGAGNNTPSANVTTVEFGHSMVVDNVTGKIVKDNGWTPSSQTYVTVKTPEVSGFTPSVKVVGGDTVKVTDGNINREYTVTYSQIPDEPVIPDTPDPDPIPVPHPEPTPEEPSVPEEDVPAPHGEDVPTAPEEEPVAPKPAKATPADEPAPKPHAAALPQTGSENDDLAALAGTAMSLIGLVGLSGAAKRRRRN